MISIPDQGVVYPKTGLDVDLRLDSTPTYVSSGSCYFSSTYLEADGIQISSAGDWSVAGWFRASTTATGTYQYILDISKTGSQRAILYLGSNGDFGHWGTGDSSPTEFGDATVIRDGTWHHVCFTVDGGTAAKVYVDGHLNGSATITSQDLSAAGGTADIGGTGSSSYMFDDGAGNLAHFGIWNAELTQAEIRSLMTATTYAEAVSKSGNTPAHYWIFESNLNASVGGINADASSGGATIVGERARLPSGLDLTGNRNAQVFSGRAILFDASADWLNGGSVAAHVFTGSFSVSMWVKTAAAAEQDFLYKFSAGVTGYKLSFRGDQDPAYFEVSISDGTGWQHARATEGNAGIPSKLDDGVWRHLVMRANNGTLECYVDGKVGATTDSYSNSTAIGAAGQRMTLGGSYAATPGNLTNGSLADIRIWNIALSAAQIAELRDIPETLIPSGAVAANLISKWDLSDYDIAGANNLDGLYFTDSGTAKSPAVANNCGMEFSQPSPVPQLGLRSSSSRIYFDQDNDLVTIGDNAAIDGLFGAGGSLAVWIMPFSDGEGNYGRIIDTAGSGYIFILRDESGGACKLHFSHYRTGGGSAAGVWITSATDLTIGQWNHVVLTYDGSSTSNDPIIYVNASAKSLTESTEPVGSVAADTGDKIIGNQADGSRTFHGIISSMAMWKGTILDADAVAAIYAGGQGFDLLSDSGNYDNSGDVDGLWVLDNSLTIQDLSTNSNNGAVSGNPNIATVPEGSTAGLSVFGTADNKRPWNGMSGLSVYQAQYNVLLANTATLPHVALGTNLFTFSFWIKIRRTKTIDNGRLFEFFDTNGIILHYVDSDTLKFYVKGASGTPAAQDVDLTAAQMYNTWAHIVVRREAAATFSFVYHPLDQTAVTISDSTGTDAGSMTPSNNVPIVLGGTSPASNQRGTSAGAGFADFRMWDAEAITDAQVDALYESGARMLRGT